MKNEKIKIAVIGPGTESPQEIAKKVQMILAESEVCSSLVPIELEVVQPPDEVKEIFILQKVEHIDPEILRREIRNDKPWKTQKWRKKLK